MSHHRWRETSYSFRGFLFLSRFLINIFQAPRPGRFFFLPKNCKTWCKSSFSSNFLFKFSSFSSSSSLDAIYFWEESGGRMKKIGFIIIICPFKLVFFPTYNTCHIIFWIWCINKLIFIRNILSYLAFILFSISVCFSFFNTSSFQMLFYLSFDFHFLHPHKNRETFSLQSTRKDSTET